MINEKEKTEVFLTRKTSDNQASYQYIFKIILIGDANIGKTSIINRYVNKVYNDKYICTIGVDFMMKSMIVNDQAIKLQIWDTAGMEKYKQITVSYYRGAQAAIVVFDLTSKSSFNSIPRWISDFSQNRNPIFEKVIIIVGNKSDMLDEREVSQEEIDAFIKMNNFVYFDCSAKTGDNVEFIFSEIAQLLYFNYKNNMDAQVRNAIQIRKSNLGNVDNFQTLIDNKKKHKCNC